MPPSRAMAMNGATSIPPALVDRQIPLWERLLWGILPPSAIFLGWTAMLWAVLGYRLPRVVFRVHADLCSFTGRDFVRIVEPGRIEVSVGASSADLRLSGSFEITGAVRRVGEDRVLVPDVVVTT